MISVDGLTVEFGGSALFSDISFVINEKDRIALMGKNGAGKSTLLKILAGVREPTRGKVSAPKDTVIAYLPQHLMTEDGRTVFEETAQAFVHLHEMEAEIAALNKELETRTDYESDSYMELIERVSTLSEKFYSIEEINYDADIEKTLLGLGFTREDFNRQTSEFSGGWRMRIELAKLLLKKPDVLLLDEPTNHLDIESIQWLEDFLIDNGQAVVVISHDRAFVDHITTRTIEVTMGRIYDYKVNYSQYLQLRKERREQQQKAYDEQQKFIAETKDFIERFKGTYSKTLQVQSMIIVSTVCFSPSSRKTWDPPILLACALVVTSSVSWSVPFSSSSKISSSVMIFVMLAGLRCSDAFFSYRTVPVCASIKRTDGEVSPRSGVISGAVSSVSSVFCSVVSFCCLSEDSPFCSAAVTFKGAALTKLKFL